MRVGALVSKVSRVLILIVSIYCCAVKIRNTALARELLQVRADAPLHASCFVLLLISRAHDPSAFLTVTRTNRSTDTFVHRAPVLYNL